ncbi:alpha/beta fold hydrolase [Paenibacillus eucommiae]|uniref:Pimeloyl-ACP methyl ester carboxylesterase n=1 Tax=Paenibacillus eucommiae TaxID=1355755 RepID=A0ABS4IPV7_9BACL|nr:alpha/beta hydrolase [Paenibacillus eucommiae]MBP1989595.1 pimeloyl-ACP methyl ester carboxylesterase [Paenibacillus eucommiae]
MKKIVTLSGGSTIEVGLTGNTSNKVIMLPVAKKSVYGQEAESLRLWGVDPELGKNLVEGLSDKFQVLYFDYEGHLLENPQPDDLTPENIAKDLLLIADEMNVRKFSYYGYSWLALVGLQLAIRTNRLESLIMGGYPPYEGPYKEMMIVTNMTYKQTLKNQNMNNQNTSEYRQEINTNPEEINWDHVQVKIDSNQTKQFFTMYQSLMDFDDKKIQDMLTIPKLAFAGEKDTIIYGENFGSVTVDIVGLLQKNKTELEHLSWDVEILKGNDMNHTKAMQPATVLPIIKPWLIDNLL